MVALPPSLCCDKHATKAWKQCLSAQTVDIHPLYVIQQVYFWISLICHQQLLIANIFGIVV